MLCHVVLFFLYMGGGGGVVENGGIYYIGIIFQHSQLSASKFIRLLKVGFGLGLQGLNASILPKP